MMQNIVEKKTKNQKNIISVRIMLEPKSRKSGIVTIFAISRRIHIIISSDARQRTHMHSTLAEEKEVVMTDDG